jgi:hypothetical protein
VGAMRSAAGLFILSCEGPPLLSSQRQDKMIR